MQRRREHDECRAQSRAGGAGGGRRQARGTGARGAGAIGLAEGYGKPQAGRRAECRMGRRAEGWPASVGIYSSRRRLELSWKKQAPMMRRHPRAASETRQTTTATTAPPLARRRLQCAQRAFFWLRASIAIAASGFRAPCRPLAAHLRCALSSRIRPELHVVWGLPRAPLERDGGRRSSAQRAPRRARRRLLSSTCPALQAPGGRRP